MIFDYSPDSNLIFPRFDSYFLYDPDKLIEENENRNEGEKEYDIHFSQYAEQVCKGIAKILNKMLGDGNPIIRSIEYRHICMPDYYKAFSNNIDRLHLDTDVDFDKLKQWLYDDSDRVHGFGKYLAAKYTAYEGYFPFVENDVEGYFEKSFAKHQDVLIDYYLLTIITKDYDVVRKITDAEDYFEYQFDLIEMANEAFYNNLYQN